MKGRKDAQCVTSTVRWGIGFKVSFPKANELLNDQCQVGKRTTTTNSNNWSNPFGVRTPTSKYKANRLDSKGFQCISNDPSPRFPKPDNNFKIPKVD